MRRSPGLLAIAMLVAACGGEADDANTAGQAGDEGETSTQPDAVDDVGSTETTGTAQSVGNGDAVDDGENGGDGPSTATVSIGDETHRFSSEGAVVAQCLTDLFGIFTVQLPVVDGGDGSIGIVALHPDTDPDVVGEVNAVTVSVGDEDWIADEEHLLFESSDQLEPGMSQVDSVEIDGSTVRGTATFVRQLSVLSGEQVETVSGSFEATCGEERTT